MTRRKKLGIWTPFVYQRLPCSIRSYRSMELRQKSQNRLLSSLNGINGESNETELSRSEVLSTGGERIIEIAVSYTHRPEKH